MTFLSTLSGARSRVYEHGRYVVVERVLDRDGPTAPAPGDSISVREAQRAEILSFASTTMGHKPDGTGRALAYLSRNYRCALGSMNGDPIGWCWWLDARILESNSEPDRQLSFCSVALEEGDAWCFAFELGPALRRRGLSSTMLREFEWLALRNGYRRIVACFDAKNAPARRLWTGNGYRTIRTVPGYFFAKRIGVSGRRLLIGIDEERSGFTTFPYRLLRQ